MSYVAVKLAQAPTGVSSCASAFITHSSTNTGALTSSLPNLVLVKANVLEIYNVHVQQGEEKNVGAEDILIGSASISLPAAAKRGGYMSGFTAAWLELVCHIRLFGTVESMAILHGSRRLRDSIILTFRDAKFSVLYFDDATQELKTSSMHYFEGPEWVHLKRGRVKFPRGPLVRADPQGRCAAVLVYKCQLVMLKAVQDGYGLDDEEEASRPSTSTGSSHIGSSYIINLEELDIVHVKDFVFLNGYIEPVVAILHEREPTWAARLSYRRDTCSVTALSINTNSKQHPRLWFQNDLPYDAYRLLAVPSPIGGVLVLCANSVLYYSQVSSCVLGLNEFATPPAGSLEMPISKLVTELDGAHATWIASHVALFTTKTGMLLLLHATFDGRNVQKLELIRSKGAVLSSCICSLGDKLCFLGSRLGDSLLLQYTTGYSSTLTDPLDEEYDEMEGDVMARPTKRIRLDPQFDDSVYQYTSVDSDARNFKFAFTVRDSLCNVGPVRDITCASEQGGPAAKHTAQELVACTGHGKNGCLALLSRSIRPELVTEVGIPGCKDVWTVYHRREGVEDVKDEYHAYLIISLDSGTMVLETGETLGEITDAVEYYTLGPTICAGNLFERRRIVQVYKEGLRVLDGARQTQDLQVGGPDNLIVSASFADPYIILQMADGSCRLVVGDSETLSISASSPAALNGSNDPVTACVLYHDKGSTPWLRKTRGDVWQAVGMSIDGDTYCIVCRSSGSMEIIELPQMVILYRVENLQYGSPLLADHRAAKKVKPYPAKYTEGDAAEIRDKMSKLHVVDLCFDTWGEKYGRPFLFALLNDGTLLAYRAFFYEAPEEALQGTCLKNLRFIRLQLDLELGDEDPTERSSVQKIVTFKDVGGLQGVFLAGGKPTWLMIFREQLRLHPQASDGPIIAFTTLHNMNCQHGLIYVTDQGVLKICQLSSVLNYDNDWPVQKIPLKGTPHQIVYHPELNVYALVVSFPVQMPASVVLPSPADVNPNAPPEQEAFDGTGAQKLVQVDEYEIRILDPSTWNTRDTVKLQPIEHVLAIRVVNIKNVSSEQMQSHLAIGTGYIQGEDVAARGRIILFSLGQDSDNISVRELYSKEQKGAISAVAALQGHLLVAIGTKILLHTWNGSELIGTAFFDAPLYVVSLNIVKNFVLFGDFHKSIYFLHWKEEGAQLALLAKDFGTLDTYATEFLIDGTTLSLLVSDSRKNIQVFSYAPKNVESWKGQKLLPRVEFHLGSHVAKFLRLQMLPTPNSPRSNRFALSFGTLDGGLGYVVPLEELTFRRLQTLQRTLVDLVPQAAGLNPRAYRQLDVELEYGRKGPDNAVDSEQLRMYEALPLDQQMAIASHIGTTRQQILANLRDLSLSTSFF